MTPSQRITNPEDEDFADRDGGDAAPKAPEGESTSNPRPGDAPSVGVSNDTEGGRPSRIVGAMSTAMKALFGIRGNRRPRRA